MKNLFCEFMVASWVILDEKNWVNTWFRGKMIQEKVHLCYNIEHLRQGKNRTGEQLVDSEKTKTVNGTLHSKVSEQLKLSVTFNICPSY